MSGSETFRDPTTTDLDGGAQPNGDAPAQEQGRQPLPVGVSEPSEDPAQPALRY